MMKHGPLKKMVNGMVRIMTAMMLLWALPGLAWAAEAESRLEFISYTTRPGEGVDLRLNLSAPPPKPSSFVINNPARITFDLPGVKNALPWTLPLPMKSAGVANSVTAVEANGRTRVVINLDKLVTYQSRSEGNSLIISLQDPTVTGQTATTTAEPAGIVPAVLPASTPEAAPATKTARSPLEAGGPNAVIDVTAAEQSGTDVQLRVKFSKQVPRVSSFVMSNPARVVVDMADTASNLSWTSRELNVGAAKTLSAVDAGNRTRLVIGLDSSRAYKTEVVGGELVISIQGGLAPATTASEVASGVIEAIDFRRGDQGEGRLLVNLSTPGVSVDSRVEGGKIMVEFMNTRLGDNLRQRLDVTDFATPVKYVESRMEGGRARIVLTPVAGAFEHMVYQADKQLTVEIKRPIKTEQSVSDGRKVYKGEKLSLNFQDIEVRALLQLIADFTGLNMVASDAVQGSLTLRLKNVPWDQALDIILRTKGLAMRQNGNVILVAPADEIAGREKAELEAKKQIEDVSPLISEMIQVNYAKAADLAKIVQGGGSATGAGSSGAGMLTPRGRLSVDERTNTLLITDTADKLVEVRKFVGKLDIPIKQVMIDTRIVIADSKFAKDIGVRFGVNAVKKAGSNLLMTSGSYTGTDNMVSSALTNLADPANRTPYPVNILTGNQNRLNVNFPAKIGAPSIGFALLGSDTLLDLELSALQTEGRGEVISNPRVISSNQKEAVIESGSEIPYQQASTGGATNVAFKKAVLGLRVTPQITPDNRILLDLQVNKDSRGEVFQGANGAQIPGIDKKELRTQVLVDDGKTLVLGGVFEHTKTKTAYKVPFLGDLPLIGVLFRSNNELEEKKELLIFVTPRIVKNEADLK